MSTFTLATQDSSAAGVRWIQAAGEFKIRTLKASTPIQCRVSPCVRFRKVSPTRIDYIVTVEDPTAWTRPFTFYLPWRGDDPTYRGPDDLFEYACHEGNFRMIENSITAAKAVRAAQGKK